MSLAASENWPAEDSRERAARAFEARAAGEKIEAIGEAMPRADGPGVGVTKARAWQVIRAEAERRIREADNPEQVLQVYRRARMKCLEPLMEAALARFKEWR